MKRNSTFYLKTGTLVLGFLLLLIAAFLPIIITRVPDYSTGFLNYKTATQITGINSYIWYALLGASLIIFATGYFFRNTVNIILVFVLTPFSMLGILFLTAMATFTIGFGPGPKIEIALGYLFGVIGAVLVITATMISVLKKKEKKQYTSSDLLDDL